MKSESFDIKEISCIMHKDGHTSSLRGYSILAMQNRISKYNEENPTDKKKIKTVRTTSILKVVLTLDSNFLVLTINEYKNLLTKKYVLFCWYGKLLYLKDSNFLRNNVAGDCFIIDPDWLIENKLEIDTSEEIYYE